VHGVRVIRLHRHRFRLELTPPLELPRDPDGSINVQGAMQAMTRVIEGWVREYPEQWLWMHRRWRPPLLQTRLKVT
jgi:KDO2-lipid IV(A) lauroyltransferase